MNTAALTATWTSINMVRMDMCEGLSGSLEGSLHENLKELLQASLIYIAHPGVATLADQLLHCISSEIFFVLQASLSREHASPDILHLYESAPLLFEVARRPVSDLERLSVSG